MIQRGLSGSNGFLSHEKCLALQEKLWVAGTEAAF